MNFLLVLRRVFSYTVKPGIRVMSFPEYLTDLNRDSRRRKIHNVQVLRIKESSGAQTSLAFLLVEKTFSTYRQFELEGKLARTGTVTEVSGGITIFTADHIFLLCSLNLVFHLNL